MRNPTKLVAFCIKLAAFSNLQKNSKFFFEKPVFFSQEEAILSTFSEILLNQLHPTTNFLSLAVFKKVNLFKKIHIFYIKKPNFEHFEKFIHSVAMYKKFATFSNFSLKKVFVRNEPIYVLKAPKFWTFWRFLLVQLHFSASLPHSAILKKNPQIFQKSHLFF